MWRVCEVKGRQFLEKFYSREGNQSLAQFYRYSQSALAHMQHLVCSFLPDSTEIPRQQQLGLDFTYDFDAQELLTNLMISACT